MRTYFAGLLAIFMPEVAAGIDPATITFLDPELFTDVPGGRQRIADLMARVETFVGQPRVILVHTEIQAKRQDVFPAHVGI